MATGSSLTQNHSRSQSEIQGDFHNQGDQIAESVVIRNTTMLPFDDIGGQSEARPPGLKSPSKLGTHLLTYCSRDEKLSRPCPSREQNPDLWCSSVIRYHSTTGPSVPMYTIYLFVNSF
ncbi:hypothetical protein TNCV_2652571 [Trichonephila clavipes]|nr:hypothetical protein TNCV_2652571 [Trichonephila clavipes]